MKKYVLASLVALALGACGTAGAEMTVRSTGSADEAGQSADDERRVAEFNNCLSDAGLEPVVTAFGDDGEPTGFELSGEEGEAGAVDDCLAEGAGRPPSIASNASKEDIDAGMRDGTRAFFACMEERGFDAEPLPDAEGEFEGGFGVDYQVPNSQLDTPEFLEAEQLCGETGESVYWERLG